jgi:hypothetical protein
MSQERGECIPYIGSAYPCNTSYLSHRVKDDPRVTVKDKSSQSIMKMHITMKPGRLAHLGAEFLKIEFESIGIDLTWNFNTKFKELKK